MSLRSSSPRSSAGEALEDELLRAVERENARSNSSAQPSRPGCCPSSPSSLVREVTPRRVSGVFPSSSARSSQTRKSPPRRSRRGQASSDVTGKSGSAPRRVPARTGSEEEAGPEQDQATLRRSGCYAVMRSALENIQEDAEGQEQLAFTKMEEAMTGLELAYGKAEFPNPPELRRGFATRWPHDDDDLSHSGVMEDPVILASGYENVCPITDKTLSYPSTAPNHRFCDMITAWHLDHMGHSSASLDDRSSVLVAPSEEQIQGILHKLSGHSVMQEQALHEIQLISENSKGVHPSLDKWPSLISVLIDLQKSWKSTWTRSLNEKLVTIILNMSVHRPNRAILGGQTKLPNALMHAIKNDGELGSLKSSFSKVTSVVAILSEVELFRKRILDIGGMEMLRDLLKIEDAVVRKLAVSAIRGLCADEEGRKFALSYNVPDALPECLMVSDDVLLLLDCLPKDPRVVDKVCDKAMELLVNIIMAEQETGQVTYSAISLVHAIVQRNAHKVEKVKNLVYLKKRLSELLSEGVPPHTVFHIKGIIQTLSVIFHSPAKLRGYIVEEKEGSTPSPAYSRPNEVAICWSMQNDEISYPLYAETLGEADPLIKSRKEWNDIRVVRKLRPLRDLEKAAARRHYEMIQNSYQKRRRSPHPIYGMFAKDRKNEERLEELKVPENLVCSLCGKVMVDPVAVTTGETFDRECLRDWFRRHGHICPVTDEPVSSTILRNERIGGYLVEWRAAEIQASASKNI